MYITRPAAGRQLTHTLPLSPDWRLDRPAPASRRRRLPQAADDLSEPGPGFVRPSDLVDPSDPLFPVLVRACRYGRGPDVYDDTAYLTEQAELIGGGR